MVTMTSKNVFQVVGGKEMNPKVPLPTLFPGSLLLMRTRLFLSFVPPPHPLQLTPHGLYNFRQTKFKDFSRRKTSFQGPMFIQYIDIFVPFFTPKTLNSVITYFGFSKLIVQLWLMKLVSVMLFCKMINHWLFYLHLRLRYRNKFEMQIQQYNIAQQK